MPPTNANATEEILEKKDTAPVTTACLILAGVAILGAIAFNIAELAGYRSGLAASQQGKPNPGELKARDDVKNLQAEVQRLLAEAGGAPALTEDDPGEAPATPGAKKGGARAAPPKDEGTDETPKEEDTPRAEEPTEEKAAAEPAPDEGAGEK